jgi:hypothetical protein
MRSSNREGIVIGVNFPTKKSGKGLVISLGALALFASVPFGDAIAAPVCTPTGFVRDSINLTAALINPGDISGDVDATGCNIGVYYTQNGHVRNANVHGANYFGIVNNGANVEVANSTVSDIGEKPFNGTQHGVAIYWAFGSAAKGNIHDNFVWNYQKGGIVVNGPNASSNIQQNTVVGLGPVDFIAQNGIQAGYGSNTQIQQNTVSGNSYTGANFASSGGILLVGGDCYGGPATTNTRVQNNTGLGNDVGVWFSNLDASCNPVSIATKDTADGNALVNNAVNNATGNGAGPYQAGVSDQGSGDVIQNNYICGPGYPGTNAGGLFAIDVSATNNPTVKNNTICTSAPAKAASLLAAPRAGAAKASPLQ